jgi:chaperonin GroEL
MVYRPNIDATSCFVLMPFHEPHLEYFAGIIQPAAREAGLTAIKADDFYGTAPIIQDIWNQIWRARAVIADVTGRNPNVNYELGICHSLGVPTVLITQSLEDVPFDYRHIRCIVYDTKRVNWEEKLRLAITGTLKSLPAGFDVYEDLRWPYDTNALQAMRNINSLVPSEEGTASVIKGARLVRDACATALGPHGTNISVSPTFGLTRFDRSGVVIAEATTSPDPLQRKGIEHANRLAREMHAAVGDGSKTAILVFQELVERGYKALQGGAVLRDLIHEMDAVVETAVHAIQEMSRAPSAEDIVSVARTAAAGDLQVGTIIAEALANTGPDGVVSLTETLEALTSVEVREGIYFDRGFLSARFITDEARQVAELSDAVILIYDSNMASMKELLPVLEQVAKAKTPLLVIAENVEGEALETLALNKERGTLSCVAVRAPLASENRRFILEDIAVATGGTVISHFSVSLESVRLNQLGRAKHVEVTKDSCWITGGGGNPEAVETRAAGIRQQIALEKGDYDIERLRERLAKPVGRVCAIHVGGASSLDRAERMYKMRSAMYSAREAVSSGVLPGGGTALFKVGGSLKTDSEAAEMLVATLEVPLRQQVANARQNEQDTLAKIKASSSRSVGFNAESRQVEDLGQSGVIDPTRMCASAVQLAFVHARAILQTGVWDLTERTAPHSPVPNERAQKPNLPRP